MFDGAPVPKNGIRQNWFVKIPTKPVIINTDIVGKIIGTTTLKNSLNAVMPSSCPYSITESGILHIAPIYNTNPPPKPNQV